MIAQDAVCTVWAHYDGDQYCSPSLEYAQQSVSWDGCVSDAPVLWRMGS